MILICQGPITPIFSFSVSLRTTMAASATSRPTITTATLANFRLRLIELTPTRFAFEIARADHKYVEVTYELDAKRFGEVQRVVHIVFGVQG